MQRKTHKPEKIVAKLRHVVMALAQGVALTGAIRGIGVSEATNHRWRNEYDGLKVDQVSSPSCRRHASGVNVTRGHEPRHVTLPPRTPPNLS